MIGEGEMQSETWNPFPELSRNGVVVLVEQSKDVLTQRTSQLEGKK